nr:Chain A, LF1 [synthetic construct]
GCPRACETWCNAQMTCVGIAEHVCPELC